MCRTKVLKKVWRLICCVCCLRFQWQRKNIDYLCRIDCGWHQYNANVACSTFCNQHTNDNEQKVHVFVAFMHFIENDMREIGQWFCLYKPFQKNTRCTIQKACIIGYKSTIQTNLCKIATSFNLTFDSKWKNNIKRYKPDSQQADRAPNYVRDTLVQRCSGLQCGVVVWQQFYMVGHFLWLHPKSFAEPWQVFQKLKFIAKRNDSIIQRIYLCTFSTSSWTFDDNRWKFSNFR